MVKTSPTLLHAVMSVAARHMGNTEAAEEAHQACVKLLVEQLTSGTVADDDALLCAIVILRVFEQLNVMVTGSDQEQHLTGCSALIRASQPSSIDPSSPTLRQAAFWVYVKQCLYNACVNQQPPNVDRSLTLLPPPVIVESDTLSQLRAETAWANTMVWMCSTVLHFCFGTGTTDPIARLGEWKKLTEALENWKTNRSATFDPVWHGEADKGSSNPFPQYFFTADWHGGPLMVDQRERDGVIDLLLYLQKTHSWPTTWIISSLKEEWEIQ
nr:hypothetical protein LTR18_004514 [Exophiala xenobiotica]